MKDVECVEFLQWALPRLGLRWRGFRKVRRQVCRRIDRRVHELHLTGMGAYRDFLEANSAEWKQLDALCHVTISRFYRDVSVFDFLERTVLPELAGDVAARGGAFEAWSAGCASGEEAYTLALIWHFALERAFPEVVLHVLATDVDETMLRRARAAAYSERNLRGVPVARRTAFSKHGNLFRPGRALRAVVDVRSHDLRTAPPAGPFDLVLCRNVAFTYFDVVLQGEVATRLASCIRSGGAVVLGAHERLPNGTEEFAPWSASPCVYRKRG